MDLVKMRSELLKGKSIYDLKLRVAYYSRVSTSLEMQLNSLHNQTTYFEDFIKKQQNWTFVEGYVDEGLSGTRTASRTGFNKMIEDGRNGKFDLLITKEVSRFARNTLDSIFYTRELLKYGVGVFFQNDNINTLEPDSELRLNIMASMAQEESRKISERTRWGKKRAIENSVLLIGGNIYGYDVIDGKLVINEEEAKIVRRIFELRCQRYGYRKISQLLQEEGYTNRLGNPFTYHTLRYITTNPRYKGYYTGNLTTKVDFLSSKQIPKDPKEHVVFRAPDLVPPIVTEKLWDKANEIAKKMSEKVIKEGVSYHNKYKYSGKIICKKHNATFYRTLYRNKTIPNKELWQCKEYREKGIKACDTPSIYTNELDAILLPIFKIIFSNKDKVLDDAINIVSRYIETTNYDKEIKNLIKQINTIQKRKDKLLDLTINDLIDKEEFKKRNEEFNNQIELLNQQKNKYEKINDAKYDSKKQLSKIREILSSDCDLTNGLPDEVIEKFINKVEVEKGEVDNLIKLKIIMNIGSEVDVFYRRDFRLSLIKHLNGNKQMFKFPRYKNQRDNHPTYVTVEIEDLELIIPA